MTGIRAFARKAGALMLVAFLSACASGAELGDERAELGDFFLSHAIVVADEATPLPGSRSATAEEWEESLTDELRRRLGRYDGDTLYHVAIKVHGYMLAPPGIPLVASPRSVLGITVDLWDDAAGERLNRRPHQIIIGEAFSGSTVVGSGLTLTREEQMQQLSENAVLSVERWLANNSDWFPPKGTNAPDPELLAEMGLGGEEDPL